MIIDTAADFSCLPMEYVKSGVPTKHRITLWDAQKNQMPTEGMRACEFTVCDEEGNTVSFKETFAITTVEKPILAAGKLLQQGWKLSSSSEGGHLLLSNDSTSIPLEFDRNTPFTRCTISMVKDATIRMIVVLDDNMKEIAEKTTRGWYVHESGTPIHVGKGKDIVSIPEDYKSFDSCLQSR